MLIDFGYKFKTFDGKPLSKGRDVEGDQTLGDVCVDCLAGTVPANTTKPKQLTGASSIAQFHLAEDIHNAKEPLDVSVSNIKLLKDLIEERYIPLVVAQAWEILDPPPVVEEVAPEAKGKPKGK